MTLAWSGVPMIFLNDNSVAVTNEAGTMPNWGLFIWGLFGSGWPFVILVAFWYQIFLPNPMAIYTLEGYGENRVSKIDPDAKKRLAQRATGFITNDLGFIFFGLSAMFGFIYVFMQWALMISSSNMGYDTVIVGY